MSKATRGLFYFEGINPIRGWAFDEDWNGFAMPFFEFKQAEQVVKLLDGYYDSGSDTFVWPSPNDPSVVEEAFGEVIRTSQGSLHAYNFGDQGLAWLTI